MSLGTLELDDDRVYCEVALCHQLGIRPSALYAARKRGELRSFKVGRKRLYRGSWLRAWIEAGTAHEPEGQAVAAC
jgi:hypothetical protein